MPDNPSEHEKCTVTVSFVQSPDVYAPPPAVADAVIVGAVLSMLMPLWVSDAEFPALSVHVPVADCPAPSADTVLLSVAETTSESVSEHDQLTVTSSLFHPAPFATVLVVNVIVGGVLSILIVLVCVASVFPALSLAEKLMVVVPSVVIENDALLPETVVDPIVCAPLAEYVISLTPLPPAVSLALRETATFCFDQAPNVYVPDPGVSVPVADVVGAVESANLKCA